MSALRGCDDLEVTRHAVARALYEDGATIIRPDWTCLSDERQSPWLVDADRAIAIVVEQCARIVDASDPEKPANYLHRREDLAAVLRGFLNRTTPEGSAA